MTARDLPDQAHQLADLATAVMRRINTDRLTVATAESCTGGLLASLLTDLPGLSAAFDRGFVTYAEAAKCDMLGIAPVAIARHGVVSREIAIAMADGVLAHSAADLAVAITGFAGAAGPDDEEGLVHLAARRRSATLITREAHYGPIGRERVRLRAVHAALELLAELLGAPVPFATQAGPATETN